MLISVSPPDPTTVLSYYCYWAWNPTLHLDPLQLCCPCKAPPLQCLSSLSRVPGSINTTDLLQTGQPFWLVSLKSLNWKIMESKVHKEENWSGSRPPPDIPGASRVHTRLIKTMNHHLAPWTKAMLIKCPPYRVWDFKQSYTLKRESFNSYYASSSRILNANAAQKRRLRGKASEDMFSMKENFICKSNFLNMQK